MFHLVQYGDPNVRRAVPLALSMLSISNPGQASIVDTLSKLSHDQVSGRWECWCPGNTAAHVTSRARPSHHRGYLPP